MTTNPPIPDRVLRVPEVRQILGGIGSTTLWRWVRESNFPQPISLGAKVAGWRLSTVNAWLDSRTPAGAANPT